MSFKLGGDANPIKLKFHVVNLDFTDWVHPLSTGCKSLSCTILTFCNNSQSAYLSLAWVPIVCRKAHLYRITKTSAQFSAKCLIIMYSETTYSIKHSSKS